MPSIEKVVKGSTPSLLQAGKANELIKAINGLANVKPRAPIKTKVFSDWSGFEIDLDIEDLIAKLEDAGFGGGGIALTDLSVTQAAASGSGSLTYDDTSGVFTFTPPDITGAATRDPLTIYKVDDDNIGIQGGVVNNIEVPSQDNIGITAETRVWLKITLDSNKDISTVEVHVPNSTTALDSTDSIAYVSIGRAFYSNGAITAVDAYANGSLGYNYGGGDYHFIYRK